MFRIILRAYFHRTQFTSSWAVAVILILALFVTACSSGVESTSTPMPSSTVTETRSILDYTPPASTRDPELGPPTLPPEYTTTPTPTETATATPTDTPTITPTPSEEEVCEDLLFPVEMVDGLTFTAGDLSVQGFTMGIYRDDASMVWEITNVETGEEEVQAIPGNSVVVIDMLDFVAEPGTYNWTVYVTSPAHERICEQTATFTLLPASETTVEPIITATMPETPSATEADLPPSLLEILLQNLLDQVRENRSSILTPTPEP